MKVNNDGGRGRRREGRTRQREEGKTREGKGQSKPKEHTRADHLVVE